MSPVVWNGWAGRVQVRRGRDRADDELDELQTCRIWKRHQGGSRSPIVWELLGRGRSPSARDISGVGIPHSRMARAVAEPIRDTESDLLFHRSTRINFWGP